LSCGRHCRDARVHSETSQDLADVIANGFLRQYESIGDITRRSSLSQELQDLLLPRGQLGRANAGHGLTHVLGMREPEDTHDVAVLLERCRADLDGHAPAVRPEDVQTEVCDIRTEELAGKLLPRAPLVLGRHDLREMPSPYVSDDLRRCTVEPANPAGAIEDVAGNADAFECALEPLGEFVELR
jgi:hypothetical protein